MEFEVAINGRKINLEKTQDGVRLNGDKHPYQIEQVGDEFLIYEETRISKIRILKSEGAELQLLVNGKETTLKVKDHIGMTLEKLGIDSQSETIINEIKAPMPGVILEIIATKGQEVEKGNPLLILEAMKMENMIKSPTNGKIKKISVEKGQSVEKNELLIQFD